jgi:hypothetical protein
VRLTSPPSGAECREIWESEPPGTFWATPGLLRDDFAFIYKTRESVASQNSVDFLSQNGVQTLTKTTWNSSFVFFKAVVGYRWTLQVHIMPKLTGIRWKNPVPNSVKSVIVNRWNLRFRSMQQL